MVHIQPYLSLVKEVEDIVRLIRDRVDRVNKANEVIKNILNQISAAKEEYARQMNERWLTLMILTLIGAIFGSTVMAIYLNEVMK